MSCPEPMPFTPLPPTSPAEPTWITVRATGAAAHACIAGDTGLTAVSCVTAGCHATREGDGLRDDRHRVRRVDAPPRRVGAVRPVGGVDAVGAVRSGTAGPTRPVPVRTHRSRRRLHHFPRTRRWPRRCRRHHRHLRRRGRCRLRTSPTRSAASRSGIGSALALGGGAGFAGSGQGPASTPAPPSPPRPPSPVPGSLAACSTCTAYSAKVRRT